MSVSRRQHLSAIGAIDHDRLGPQQHDVGILEQQIDAAPGQSRISLLFESLSTGEGHAGVELGRVAKPGLEWRLVGSDIMSPGAEAFLYPQAFQRKGAGIAKAERSSG